MGDWWLDAVRIAQKHLPEVVLEERPHWNTSSGYKSYDVKLGDKVLGHVEQADETLERRPKGARYVTRRWTRKAWCYEAPKLRSGMYYTSRKRAVEELLTHLALQKELT